MNFSYDKLKEMNIETHNNKLLKANRKGTPENSKASP